MAQLFQGITVQGLYSDVTGNALFGTVGSAAPTEALAMGGSDGTNIRLLSVDATGKVNVNASIAPPSDTIATGTLTNPADTVVVATTGTSALMVNVALSAAITAGSILFEVSLDGTNYIPAALFPVFPDGSPAVSSVTTAGQWQIPVGGVQKFRTRAAAGFAGGPATITLTAGQGQYSVVALSDNAANFLATVSQGTANWTTNTTQVGGAAISLGQKTSAASFPVVIASDQAVFPVNIEASGTALTATGSSLNVNVTDTVTVTGTVAVTQSTSPWVVAGNKTNNNAAPNGSNVGALVALANAAAPTDTEGFAVLLSVDLAGNLRTKDIADGAAGAAAPAQTTQVGGSDGTNLRALLTSTTGQLHVIADSGSTTVVTGTVAVTQSTSPWVVSGTVTANAGTGTFSVAGTLTNNNAAPAANNVGVLSALANAANPTFTEGDQTLVSVDLSGHQRTVDKADGATGAAAPATAIQSAGQDSAGNLQALRVSTNRTQVTIPADEALAASLSWFSFDTGAVQISSANPAVTPIISVETNSASVVFLIRGISVTTNGTLTFVKLIKNGTLTGSTFTGTEGNMKTDTAATAISGGTVVWSGYVGSGVLNPQLLQAAADGTPGDKFTIVVTSLSGTTKVSASIQWSESAAAL